MESCIKNPELIIALLPTLLLFYMFAHKWCKKKIPDYNNFFSFLHPGKAFVYLSQYLFKGPGFLYLFASILISNLLTFTFGERIHQYLQQYFC